MSKSKIPRWTNALVAAGGVGVGAGLMYLLDPDRGRRRRALLRDRAAHAFCETRETLGKAARDARNRARGLYAEAGAAFRREEVSDEVLVERVRSQVGHAAAEARDVEVLASGGRVTLRGVVPEGEAARLLRRVRRVRGVRAVESQLMLKGRRAGAREAVGKNGNGKRARGGKTLSLLAACAGGGLSYYGAKRRGLFGSAASVAGLAMLKRGLGVRTPVEEKGRNGGGEAPAVEV